VSGSSTTYGVIGVGSLAAAIVTGLCLDDPPPVVLSPRSAVTSADLAERLETVWVAADNQAVVDAADVVLVCVLPHQLVDVLGELRFRPDQLVLSVAAGVGLEKVARLAAPAARVARAMPLPSVARRAGATPVHPPLPEVVALFDRLGGAIAAPEERTFQALTVPAATIGAHFALLGTLARWLADHGMAEPDARRYVAATFAGLVGELEGTPDFDALVSEVSTPEGLNQQLVQHLRDAGVAEILRSGLDGVLERLIVAEN
jgi:pyrroline-5-carboxylate reductase